VTLWRCNAKRIVLQLFHVAIMLSTLRQADAVYCDFKTRRATMLLLPRPSVYSAAWPIVSVICAELCCIAYFYQYTRRQLDLARTTKKHF